MVEHFTVTANGCETRCEIAGSGRDVVLIHGLGGSRQLWSDVRDLLASDFRVIAYDLRASGETRESTPADLSLDVWSNDLRELLEQLDTTRPVLMGHSLGASIAVKYALRWPDQVEALVLMGADARLSRLKPRMQKAIQLIEEIGIARWVEEHWSKNTPFSATSLERRPEILARYRAMVLANDPQDYVRMCLAIARSEDISDALARVGHPTLVVVGGADDRTLPDDGRRIADQMPNATVLDIPHAGHTLPLEAPRDLVRALKRFLGERAAG